MDYPDQFILYLVVETTRPLCAVPTPVNLVKYIEDPGFEHEDFTSSAAGTLRARVSSQHVGTVLDSGLVT